MRKFIVDQRVFEVFPDYCLGVVAAKGIDNGKSCAEIDGMLRDEAARFAEKYAGANLRELTNIRAVREAFYKLGINPNKFFCSIEALAKRVQKSGSLPSINPVVDLGNAFSLKYLLPLGAHDIGKMESDIEVRFSTADDRFTEMGAEEPEAVPPDELVYVCGHTVKTRRWMWRQSEDGKITGQTNHVFFPIDGFENADLEAVMQAREELASFLRTVFGCEVRTGFVCRSENSFVLD